MNGTAITRQLKAVGFVHLGALNPKETTLAIAGKIGSVIKIPGLSEVQRLSPKREEGASRNTYSGNYGMAEFPLHTDLAHWHQPPRYFLLRCIVPDPEVATLFLPFSKALRGLSSATRDRALFKPRRKLDRKMFFLRFAQNELFRWDPLYIAPENEDAVDVTEHIYSLNKSHFDKVYLIKAAQSILVDNWRILHGRSDVTNPISSRLIERVYFSELYL